MVFNDLVDIYRATMIQDSYGSHRNWTTPRRIISSPAIVLPVGSRESKDPNRELSEITVNIYLRPVDVRASDRVKVNGVWFEVTGEPIQWNGRTASYMRITARRVV